MPIASLDPTFVSLILHLQGNGANASLAATNTTTRVWHLPTGVSNPLLVDSLGTAFTRTAIGEKYGEAMTSALASSGDAASLSLQSDYLAMLERSFRSRHASSIRCKLHAAGRRAGHSSAASGVFARVGACAQDLLLSGGVGFKARE